MRWPSPAPRVDAPELLDEPEQPGSDVRESLADLRRLNRWFFGAAITIRHALALIPAAGSDITLLDIACGSGDIPQALVHQMARRGTRAQTVLLDRSLSVLTVARQTLSKAGAQNSLSTYRSVTERDRSSGACFVRADARSLPFAGESIDLVTLSLALHHFPPDDAVHVLREMDRVARVAWIVNDLSRSRLAFWTVYAITSALRMNRLTRHDGPVSTLRAYTRVELQRLAERAGLPDARVYGHPFFRMSMVGRKEG